LSNIRRSLAYTIADSYLALPLQIVGTMVISRLLTPVETGVFAVAAVFASLASTFRDFGVAEYLIQEKELNHEKIRAAFAVNIATSWAMGLLLFFCAPQVGAFYRNQGVADVMRVQAFSFFLIPFGAVVMANFRRQLDFRPIFIAGVLTNLTTFVVGSVCALRGLGSMSLAWSSLAGVVVTVGTSLWYRPADFPIWPGIKGIGTVFHFGKFASGIYIFGQIGKGAPEMVIGRAQDMAGAALFSRSSGLIEIFNRTVLRSVMPVCLPYFAKSGRESGGITTGYLRSVSYITVIGWPFLAFVGLVAYSAIRIVYGDQWIASVPLAQILCLVGAVELVHYLAKEALMAGGDIKRSNTLQMCIQASRIAGVMAVIPFGLTGACWGLLFAAIVGAMVSQWHLSVSLGLRALEVLRACIPSVYITILSAAPVALWVAYEGISEANFLRYAYAGGAITASAWLWAVRHFHHPIWRELTAVFHQMLQKYQTRQRPLKPDAGPP
jgi:O-antigen/teichoic acid export membrane protein